MLDDFHLVIKKPTVFVWSFFQIKWGMVGGGWSFACWLLSWFGVVCNLVGLWTGCGLLSLPASWVLWAGQRLSCAVPIFLPSVAADYARRVSAKGYYDSFGSRHDELPLSALLLWDDEGNNFFLLRKLGCTWYMYMYM